MLTETTAHTAIADAIVEIAPDVDPTTLSDTTDLREDLELDSMDFLNVVVAVHDRTGVDVPERDYSQIQTLGHFAAYLANASQMA